MNWSIITNFVAEPGKSPASELAVSIGIPLFIALALFGFGVSREREGGKGWVKYLALLPLAWGLIYGWDYFSFAMDPLARAGGLIGGNSYYMHLGAFILPLIGVVIVIGWGIVSKFLTRNAEDF